MTSEIDKLKHFHVEDYSGIYFTDELNALNLLKILVLLLNNLVILPVENRIKFILHGESTLLILLIMELEEKVKELIKWYMDTYGVNKDQAARDIESVMLRISHK